MQISLLSVSSCFFACGSDVGGAVACSCFFGIGVTVSAGFGVALSFTATGEGNILISCVATGEGNILISCVATAVGNILFSCVATAVAQGVGAAFCSDIVVLFPSVIKAIIRTITATDMPIITLLYLFKKFISASPCRVCYK